METSLPASGDDAASSSVGIVGTASANASRINGEMLPQSVVATADKGTMWRRTKGRAANCPNIVYSRSLASPPRTMCALKGRCRCLARCLAQAVLSFSLPFGGKEGEGRRGEERDNYTNKKVRVIKL